MVLLALLILSFVHQEIKLRADKRLETFKACANNPPYSIDNLTAMENYLKLCEIMRLK